MSKNARERSEAQQIELIRTLEDKLAEVVKQSDTALNEVACSVALIAAKDAEIEKMKRACAEAHRRIEELYVVRDTLQTQIGELAAKHEELKQGSGNGGLWREMNMTFGALTKTAVESSRLAGLEIEIEGRTYLIGDVNPDGGQFGQVNQAFRRDSVITRARVRVKR